MQTLVPALWLAIGLGAAPAQADDYHVGKWHVMEAEDTGLPLATLTTNFSQSLGALALVCRETGGMLLRLDIKGENRPQRLQVRNDTGETVELQLDDDGSGSEANLTALQKLYAKATGSRDKDPSSRVDIWFRADTERKWVLYDLQGFNTVLRRVSTVCYNMSVAPSQVAEAAPAPANSASTRSSYANATIAKCQRGIPSQNVPGLSRAQCECQANTVIAYARRQEPNLPGYPDMLLSGLLDMSAYMEGGGNPMGAPARLQMHVMRFPDAAFVNFMKVMADFQTSMKQAEARCR